MAKVEDIKALTDLAEKEVKKHGGFVIVALKNGKGGEMGCFISEQVNLVTVIEQALKIVSSTAEMSTTEFMEAMLHAKVEEVQEQMKDLMSPKVEDTSTKKVKKIKKHAKVTRN